MRTPEEQEYFVASGRFERWSMNDRQVFLRTIVILALCYWVFAVVAFLVNFFGEFSLRFPGVILSFPCGCAWNRRIRLQNSWAAEQEDFWHSLCFVAG